MMNPSTKTARGPLSVIVAEKYPLARATLAALLSHDGYRVFQAENAKAAVALIEALPDLGVLLADLDMLGWRSVVSQTVKRTGVTIIAMEGMHPYSDMYDLRERGISGSVQKPILYSDLLELIRERQPLQPPRIRTPEARLTLAPGAGQR
jgi:DNA-binding response OmpR family regulator